MTINYRENGRPRIDWKARQLKSSVEVVKLPERAEVFLSRNIIKPLNTPLIGIADLVTETHVEVLNSEQVTVHRKVGTSDYDYTLTGQEINDENLTTDHIWGARVEWQPTTEADRFRPNVEEDHRFIKNNIIVLPKFAEK